MLVVEDFSLDTFKRDIIIETRNKELNQISHYRKTGYSPRFFYIPRIEEYNGTVFLGTETEDGISHRWT
jgi:hypothetical protein